MADFFNYLREMFEAVMRNIGTFFYKWVVVKWLDMPNEFQDYGDIWRLYHEGFGVWGYILLVITILALLAIFGGLIYLLYRLIRRYVKFYKTELDKDRLVDEVERLNYELYRANNDKNRILDLQIASLGG